MPLPSEATQLDETEQGKVRCVIVTPERAVLDAVCDMVILPMYDGELGVLAGPGAVRRPARAGRAAAEDGRGGGPVLRGRRVRPGPRQRGERPDARAIPAKDVTAEKAQAARAEAEALTATDEVSRTNRTRAFDRARGMAKVAAKNPV